MNFVLRRSLPSLGGLVGLLLAVGFLAVATVGAPLWFPVALAIVVIVVQYAVNPLIIEWLVPAVVVAHDGQRYALDHPLCASVARRCRDAGIPLVRLAIVDDGTPNAFTFGRTPRDARLFVTRGLIERLDDTELDAVVAHEVGHIKNWDFAVMTVAAVVPMVLYLLYLTTRSSRDARHVAIGAYAAYVVSQFIVLALSRAREYGADHWSCQCTGNGDALASALIKIAYGMGRVSADEKEQVAALVAQGKEGAAAARELQARNRRAHSMRAMGIFEPKSAEAMAHAFSAGIDPERAVAALRWDAVNPWATVLEKLSSHPLIVNRIRALEESGLPGAPTRFSVLRMMARADHAQVLDARARFGKELVIGVAPYGIVGPLVLFGAFTGSAVAIGFALSAAGILFLVKQQLRYPAGRRPVDEVASLLERMDAGPMGGIPVEVKGRIIGRGFPGYRLSPDLVLEDGSGFVPLIYRQPVLPFLATLFGLLRAEKFIGQEVVARGWYRRTPGPSIELERVFAPGGLQARSFTVQARYAGSAGLLLIGVFVTLVGLSG
ncbi:MAG: M48 family metalloprotease [Actinomycetota bacterium]|jgi:Zn-dependent protease with chaperone function